MTWRWPWVSRGRYDDMLAQRDEAQSSVTVMRGICNAHYQSGGDNLIRATKAEERAARAETQFDDLLLQKEAYRAARQRERDGYEAKYADLLARYHMLKLQAATTPEPERVIPERAYDPILTAINNACAGKDPKVRAGMLKQVAIDKAAELSEADIILRIQRGNRPAEDVA